MTATDETQELAPVAYVQPQSKDSGACGAKTPCGGKCVMNGRYHHQYHTCYRKDCAECHSDERFKVKK